GRRTYSFPSSFTIVRRPTSSPLLPYTTLFRSNGGTFEQSGGFTWTSGTITNNGSFRAANGPFTTGTGTLSGNPIELVQDSISPNGTGSASFIVHGSNTLEANVASGYSLKLEGTTTFGA